MPGWCQSDAQKAHDELKETSDECKKTINDSGMTPLTCTITDAEALDSKAKAAAKCLTNMLVAAEQRNA